MPLSHARPTDLSDPLPSPSSARVPGWAVGTAALTPLGMIGGWTLAAAVQDPGFDPVRDTISALATQSMHAPAIMTAGLALTGLGHVATAAALRSARAPGRVALAVGGLATLLVAALPVDSSPRAHGVAAAIGFGALSIWPVLASRRGGPGPLRPAVAVASTGALLALLTWFVVELQGLGPDAGAATGLAERAVAGAQSVWPLVVVGGLLRAARARDRTT